MIIKKNTLNSLFVKQSGTYIIAEIGINHEGSVERCADMIKAFARAGADAIKLQTVDADKSYAPDTESYQLFKAASLSPAETENMFTLARQCGVESFTTSGDLHSLEWVDKLNPVAHKISSGLLTCLPIVEATCKKRRPVLMSTGMSDSASIEPTIAITREYGCAVALFQCTSEYPCPPEKLNLGTIQFLKEKFNLPVGFSDHSIGTEMAYLSVAAGASLIEKHVSFDKKRPSFDHGISLEADEFAEMVKKIRLAEVALGSPQKTIDPKLKIKSRKFQRRLAAAGNLEAGHTLTLDDLLFMRFTNQNAAVPATETNKVIGKTLIHPIKEKHPIGWQDIQ